MFGLIDSLLRDVGLAQWTLDMVLHPLVDAFLVVMVPHVARKNYDQVSLCWGRGVLGFFVQAAETNATFGYSGIDWGDGGDEVLVVASKEGLTELDT